MMHCAYDELYLPLAQRMMGDMYDYAVNALHYPIEEFQKLFLVSGMAHQIEIGNPTYVAGKNGCEVAREVIQWTTGEYPVQEDEMYLDKSMEYWIGWSLAYYQWETSHPFGRIEDCVPVKDMYGMYATLHEADIALFVEIMEEHYEKTFAETRLRRLRAYAGLSQRQLSAKAEVPLRQIQLFEQGERDITKTQAGTLQKLSRALNCRMEDLM